MFSSTNNLHLFPLPQYFPPSSSSYHLPLLPPPPPPPSNPADIFIHQDPLQPLPAAAAPPFLGTSATPLQVSEEAATIMKNEQQDGQCYSGLNGFLTKKVPAKKDRHSKIYTAQGLRDRRVRLSIEISRKFFDLQDMLGYDKASKTLDWLLTKSRKAIKELTTKTKNSSKNLYFDSECEVISSETNDEAEKMLGKSPSPSSSKKNTAASFHDVMVKESRAKARARARERTKEKIMSKSQAAAVPEILNQLRPPPPSSSSSSSHLQLESCTSSAIPIMQRPVGVHPSDQTQAMKENNIIGIMWKPSPIGSSYQKNGVVISKGDGYYNNCNNFYFPTNLPQNWDINVDAYARAQSGFCSIANMDSFSELQVCGKPWETCNNNNHHLH